MEEKDDKSDVLLTEEEVWSVVNFARSIEQGMYNNQLSVSERLKEINLNPMRASQDALEKALTNPNYSEFELQRFSQDFEVNSMVYKRLISYLANMLSFDITYTTEVKKTEEYKTPKYEKDLRTVETFLDKFEYKKEFRIVIREMLRNDAYFGCFRQIGEKYILQELPSEYCKITGRWENGFLFSFNMIWFLQDGVDINTYPSFFKKKYNELFSKDKKTQHYNPSLFPNSRGSSTWSFWVEVPVSIGVCFKLSPELATRLPYFTPLFSDLVLQSLMRNLQKNMNMAAASKIIMGEVPLLSKETKATVRDSIAISPELLGKFMALIKSAFTDSIKVVSAPLKEIDGISFDTDNEMYDSYLRTALASSGINTNLIFSSSVKPNAIETQLSLNVDEQMMGSLYEQFDSFMDYQVAKLTKNYKFIFAFEGTDFSVNREVRLETAMTLFNQGIVLPQKIAAAIGMKPSQFRRQLEEASATGFMSLLTPPSVEIQKRISELTPDGENTSLDKSNPNKTVPNVDEETGMLIRRGRPQKRTSTLGEEGQKTRETASNIGRGGKM